MNMFEITLDQHMDMIEYAGNTLDKHDLLDSSALSLVEVCTSFSIRKYVVISYHFDFFFYFVL